MFTGKLAADTKIADVLRSHDVTSYEQLVARRQEFAKRAEVLNQRQLALFRPWSAPLAATLGLGSMLAQRAHRLLSTVGISSSNYTEEDRLREFFRASADVFTTEPLDGVVLSYDDVTVVMKDVLSRHLQSMTARVDALVKVSEDTMDSEEKTSIVGLKRAEIVSEYETQRKQLESLRDKYIEFQDTANVESIDLELSSLNREHETYIIEFDKKVIRLQELEKNSLKSLSEQESRIKELLSVRAARIKISNQASRRKTTPDKAPTGAVSLADTEKADEHLMTRLQKFAKELEETEALVNQAERGFFEIVGEEQPKSELVRVRIDYKVLQSSGATTEELQNPKVVKALSLELPSIEGLRLPVDTKLVRIPGGVYMMGDSGSYTETYGLLGDVDTMVDAGSDGDPDEKPLHRVVLSPFYVSAYAVSNRLFRLYRKDHDSGMMFGDEGVSVNGDKMPAVNIKGGRLDVLGFVAWMNKNYPGPAGLKWRLQREAEKEYLMRDVNQSFKERKFYKHYAERFSYNITVDDKRFVNGYGIHNARANIGEWCEDRYGNYSERLVINPSGAERGDQFVWRGDGRTNMVEFVRAARRSHGTADTCRSDLGFRLVLALETA